MGKYETKNSSSVVRSFGAASAEMFQPEVNASSYQIRRRYFRLQKFIRHCIGFGGKRGYAGMRVCGYAGMRVRRTGLTNRFQKLINNSNKIIAVNTKNHSCEGVFICGKTHVDFYKTLTSIFSAYTTSIY